MNLHEEFYDFRQRVWDAFEKLVQKGCDFIGDFPIDTEEKALSKDIFSVDNGKNYCREIIINGIIADSTYRINPLKESEKDIDVITNTIQVKIQNISHKEEIIVEVVPDILDLQTLSTYISGGYSVYK